MLVAVGHPDLAVRHDLGGLVRKLSLDVSERGCVLGFAPFGGGVW